MAETNTIARAQYTIVLENETNTDTIEGQGIRATDQESLCEWSRALCTCLHEFDESAGREAPAKKHLLFTRENVVRIVRKLIRNGKYTISRELHTFGDGETSDFAITFDIDTKSALDDELVVRDSLCFVLLRENIDAFEMRAKRIEAQFAEIVARREREMESRAVQMMEFRNFARNCAIVDAIQEASLKFGTIHHSTYDIARRIFAAEVDGNPIVFPFITAIQYGWLSCVICFHAFSDQSYASYVPNVKCQMLVLHTPSSTPRPIRFVVKRNLSSSVRVVIGGMPKNTGGYTVEEMVNDGPQQLPSDFCLKVPYAYSALLGTSTDGADGGAVPIHVKDLDREISRDMMRAEIAFAAIDIPKDFIDLACGTPLVTHILKISANRSTLPRK